MFTTKNIIYEFVFIAGSFECEPSFPFSDALWLWDSHEQMKNLHFVQLRCKELLCIYSFRQFIVYFCQQITHFCCEHVLFFPLKRRASIFFCGILDSRYCL